MELITKTFKQHEMTQNAIQRVNDTIIRRSRCELIRNSIPSRSGVDPESIRSHPESIRSRSGVILNKNKKKRQPPDPESIRSRSGVILKDPESIRSHFEPLFVFYFRLRGPIRSHSEPLFVFYLRLRGPIRSRSGVIRSRSGVISNHFSLFYFILCFVKFFSLLCVVVLVRLVFDEYCCPKAHLNRISA